MKHKLMALQPRNEYYSKSGRESRFILGSFPLSWEQRKVREIADRYDNLRIPVASNLRTAGSTPYYGANGIQDYVEGFTHDGEFVLVAEDGANDLKNYPVKCVKGRIWVNNHAHVLQGKQETTDNRFLAYAISQADIESILVGGSRAKLNAETLMEVELLLPSKDEQIEIGNYIVRIDRLITLHQREYAYSCILPSDGSFSILFGLSLTWEQRKLGECFAERVESMPDGELISVTINDGIKKFSELGRHDNSNDNKSKYKKVCVGDIAYNSMRMWQGASGYSPYEGIVSPAYTVLSPNSGVDSKCISYLIKRPDMIHTFQVNSQGITSDNWNLKYPALSEIEIMISKNIEEQRKIAAYFEHLDNLITLHQREPTIRNWRYN